MKNLSFADYASLTAALVIITAYLLFLVFLSFNKKKDEEALWTRRLGETIKKPFENTIEDKKLIRDAVDTDNYFKSKLARIDGFTQWLQHSGHDISPVLFIILSLGLGIVIFSFSNFLIKIDTLFSFLIGAGCSFAIPWIVITYLIKKQKSKFLEDFPIALDMIHRALRAGHSSDKSLEMVAEHTKGPLKKVFQQISDKIHIGEPPEIVLANVANQVGIDEFRMLSIVLVLQRETGGSLAEIIENFSKIIRARQNLLKKMRSLTGEVRATAILLTCIPFAIAGIIYLTNPRYLDGLFYTETGHILLGIGIFMLALGIYIIFRMAYEEVY